MDEMLENHDGRLPDEGDGDGGVPPLSRELVRFKPDLGMGMGLASAAPLASVRPWVLVEFERCRVFTGAGTAIVSEVAVVVVGGGGEPMGWRGGGDDFCSAFLGAEGGVFFGALSVTQEMSIIPILYRARALGGNKGMEMWCLVCAGNGLRLGWKAAEVQRWGERCATVQKTDLG